jgi:hypothetical protein
MADDFWSVKWEEAAQQLFCRAKEVAEIIGDDYIGTQHLLLAAAAITPVEQHAILMLKPDSVRAEVIAVRERRRPDIVTLTRWSQTPRFKLAIEHAMQRAFGEAGPVCCRDIWYGLLADSESESTRVLHRLGIRVEELSRALT